MRRSIIAHSIVALILFVLVCIGPARPDDLSKDAIVCLQYDSVFNATEDIKVKRWTRFNYAIRTSRFENGLCNVISGKNLSFGYINMQYREAIPCEYHFAYPFHYSRAVVESEDGNWAVLDGDGRQIVSFGKYSRIFPYSDGLAQVFDGGKTGYIGLDGELVVPLNYLPLDENLERANQIGRFREGLAAVKTGDGHCVFINNKNTIVIRDIAPVSPFYDGLALVRAADGMAFIDKEGRNAFDRSYSDAAEFREELAYVRSHDGSRGYINRKGEMVINLPDTDSAFGRTFRGFYNGYSVVERIVGEGSSYYLCAPNGGILNDRLFREVSCVQKGLAIFIENDGRNGILSVDGSLHYDVFEIWLLSSLNEMYRARFGEEGHWWFYESSTEDDNDDFRTQIFCTSRNCFRLEDLLCGLPRPTSRQLMSTYRDGLAIAANHTGRGFIDKEGKERIPFEYFDSKPFSEGLAAVCRPVDGEKAYDEWEYIDTEGKQVIPPLFSSAGQFSNGMAVVEISIHASMDELSYADGREYEGESNAVINRQGKILFASQHKIIPSPSRCFAIMQIDYQAFRGRRLKAAWFVNERGDRLNKEDYLSIRPMNEARAFVKYTEEEKFSLIGGDFAVIARDLYDDARFFSEGYCAVKVGAHWGYCDVSGKQVIPPQFSEAYDFEGGFARVSIGNAQSSYPDLIDKSGKRVIGRDLVFYIYHGVLSDLVPNDSFSIGSTPHDK